MSNLADLAAQIESGDLISDADRNTIAKTLRQAEPLSHRRARRDTILRQLAADHYPHLSQRAQSNAIRNAARGYETSGWRHDKHKITNPRRPGTIEAALWDALTAYPRALSDRQMRAILAT